jgi:hypothetical protein
MTNNEPVAKLRDRGLTVTVWENTSEDDKKYYSSNLTKSYKDNEDNWQETTNLNADDMLRASNLLQQAYNKILELRS